MFRQSVKSSCFSMLFIVLSIFHVFIVLGEAVEPVLPGDIKRTEEYPAKKSKTLDSSDAWSYYKRGDNAFVSGDYRNAIKEFTKAIELDPRIAMAYLDRGRSYLALDEPQEEEVIQAIKDFTDYLKLKPTDKYVLMFRALAYHSIKKYKEAIDDFTTLIEAFPDNRGELYYSRATLYELSGNTKKAIEDYKKSAENGYDMAIDGLRSRGITWEPKKD
jgi:tetratricopeptide (TPR) repeat protein